MDRIYPRIKIKDNFSYIESNEPFNQQEIDLLNHIAKTFEEVYITQEKKIKRTGWKNGNNTTNDRWCILSPHTTLNTLVRNSYTLTTNLIDSNFRKV